MTALLFWCLIALFYSDLVAFRLPDPLTLALLLIGLALAVLQDTVRDGLLGALVGVTAFWLIRLAYQIWRGREGLGLGDVKLMAGIGATVGWAGLPVVTLIAALMALGVALAQAAFSKNLPDARTKLPFGSFLCGAAGIVMLASGVISLP